MDRARIAGEIEEGFRTQQLASRWSKAVWRLCGCRLIAPLKHHFLLSPLACAARCSRRLNGELSRVRNGSEFHT
jgi:hypothetical protein